MQDKWMHAKEPLISLDFLYFLCILKIANLLINYFWGISFKPLYFLLIDSVNYTQMAVDSASICPQVVTNLAWYQAIREAYLRQHFAQNKYISEILDVEDETLLSILDPL